ncbi:MAG: Rdx family protein [Polyangiaceae bacterium]|nr:Rdx family protein [Polyangiaceae bacterium]
MERAKGYEVKLVVGRPGQFDVIADGKLLFSKADAGRFPEHAEVIAALP